MITVFWECEGVILADAMQRGGSNQLQCLHEDADRTQKAFQKSLANRSLAFSLTMQGRTHV
jgi:hypothetical protein